VRAAALAPPLHATIFKLSLLVHVASSCDPSQPV
jgi:hypothetical protein